MSTWRSLAMSTPGTMIEIIRHPDRVACKLIGHSLRWDAGAVACRHCSQGFETATIVILDGLDTLEGQLLVAYELRQPPRSPRNHRWGANDYPLRQPKP